MKKVKLFYYYAKENFGDVLNMEIAKDIFKIEVQLSHPYHCDYTMIGSILEPFILNRKNLRSTTKKIIFPEVNIFGSGFITDQKTITENYIRKIKLHAVRGTSTRDRFSRNLRKDFSKIPLGDPGLLASKLLKEKKEKKFEIGIIPHMLNANDPQIDILKKEIPNSIIISMLDPVHKVLEEISQCKMILSNAMHGLIAADSFGIPNKRLLLSNELIGGDYKFKDYYSAFGIDIPKPLDINNLAHKTIASKLNDIEKDYKITHEKVLKIQETLLEAAPF